MLWILIAALAATVSVWWWAHKAADRAEYRSKWWNRDDAPEPITLRGPILAEALRRHYAK